MQLHASRVYSVATGPRAEILSIHGPVANYHHRCLYNYVTRTVARALTLPQVSAYIFSRILGALSFTHKLSLILFFFYQSTMLSSHAEDGHTVVCKVHQFVSNLAQHSSNFHSGGSEF